jgi:hypothetical protein
LYQKLILNSFFIGVALSGLEMVWIYFHRALSCAIVFCPFGALTHPLPFSFEKEKGDTKISSYNCSPSLIQLERGELKGVSEN